MQLQQGLVMIVAPSIPLGHLLTTVITALVAGAFNMRAARNMAEAVRRSLESRTDVQF